MNINKQWSKEAITYGQNRNPALMVKTIKRYIYNVLVWLCCLGVLCLKCPYINITRGRLTPWWYPGTLPPCMANLTENTTDIDKQVYSDYSQFGTYFTA